MIIYPLHSAAQHSDESHAACIQNTRYLVTTVPGNSVARGAIPSADMLSDDDSVAKCDTKLTLDARFHANPHLPVGFPSLFVRDFNIPLTFRRQTSTIVDVPHI